MVDKNMEDVLRRLDELEKRNNALSELENRIQFIEDTEQIKQLFRRYINARTLRDSQAEVECFAEDGALALGAEEETAVRGKEKLAEFVKANEAIEGVRVKPVPTEGQFLVHPLISFEEDKANGKWLLYTLFCHRITRQALFWTQATYDVDYIKENGEWKIHYIRWQPLIQPPGPPPYDLPGPWPPEGQENVIN